MNQYYSRNGTSHSSNQNKGVDWEMSLCETCKYNIFAIKKDGSLKPYCERRNEPLRLRNKCPVYIEKVYED